MGSERFSSTLQRKSRTNFCKKDILRLFEKSSIFYSSSSSVSNDAFNEKLESSIHGSIFGFTSIFVNRLKHLLCSWFLEEGRKKSKGGFLGKRRSCLLSEQRFRNSNSKLDFFQTFFPLLLIFIPRLFNLFGVTDEKLFVSRSSMLIFICTVFLINEYSRDDINKMSYFPYQRIVFF